MKKEEGETMERSMAEKHLCVGPWTSKVNGQDDGLILILIPPDPVTGNFSGTHFVPDGKAGFVPLQIQGTCEHPGAGGGGAHFMRFQETNLSQITLVYSGVIVPNGSSTGQHMIPHGKRQRLFIDLRKGHAAMQDDEEWVATKTT